MYGADKSIAELIRALEKKLYTPMLLIPEDGPLQTAVSEGGTRTIVAEFAHGERKFLKPLQLLRFLRNTLASAGLISLIIQKEQIDLVHSNTSACLASAIAARLAKKPHIWHIRELFIQPRWIRLLYKLLIPILADKAIGASQAVKRNYCASWNRLEKKFIVLPHGIEPGKFESANDTLRPEYEIPSDVSLVGNVGMIRSQKGQEVFLSVARLIKENHPRIKFVVAGDLYYEQGKVDPCLVDVCNKLALTDDVLFTGFRSDIENVFASFDVLAHTSLSQEAYGRTILEAMAAGKPVVAFDDGGPRELVINGLTGFLIPVGDISSMSERILILLKDDKLRAKMGLEARRRFNEKYSMGKYIRNIQAVYGEQLGS
jgi:glycosyltransferase involved in cell wall biosynthesis